MPIHDCGPVPEGPTTIAQRFNLKNAFTTVNSSWSGLSLGPILVFWVRAKNGPFGTVIGACRNPAFSARRNAKRLANIGFFFRGRVAHALRWSVPDPALL